MEPADLAGAGGLDTEVAGARHLRRVDRWQQPHDRHDHRAGRRPRGRAIAAARCADTVDGGEAALVSGMAHGWRPGSDVAGRPRRGERFRSEEHTSELQSLMRIAYAVFCLKKKNTKQEVTQRTHRTI